MDRVKDVNASKEYAFEVKGAVLLAECCHVWIGWVRLMPASKLLLRTDIFGKLKSRTKCSSSLAFSWRAR